MAPDAPFLKEPPNSTHRRIPGPESEMQTTAKSVVLEEVHVEFDWLVPNAAITLKTGSLVGE
jgi:hypothetical protein